MSKKTLLLIVILGIITVGLLFLALSTPTTQQKEVFLTPTPTLGIAKSPASDTTLSMTEESGTTAATRVVSVNIDTGKNSVTGVQMEIAFDPNSIQDVSVAPGDFFSNPNTIIKNIDFKNGRISYALAVQLSDTGRLGTGTVTTINFSLKPTVNSTNLSFLPKTVVTGEGALASVLKKSTGVNIK